MSAGATAGAMQTSQPLGAALGVAILVLPRLLVVFAVRPPEQGS